MRFTNLQAFLCRFSLCLAMMLGFFQIANFAATKSKVKAEKNQTSALWQQKTGGDLQSLGRRFITPDKYQVYGLDRNNLSQILDRAPLEFSAEAARTKPVILEIPAPDGTMAHFRIEDSPILSTEVAAQYPGWKTFQGYGVEDPTATARFDYTPSGFHAYILSGGGSFSIDPFQENDRGNYIVYYKKDLNRDSALHCNLEQESGELGAHTNDAEAPSFSNGSQLRTYRLAVAGTGEYTAFFGSAAAAFNQVVTSVNRVSGVYRKELAVTFSLVSTTNTLYTTTTETPADYQNNGSSGDITANQTNIDSIIGAANYDIGHLFETGPGGIAQLGSVCGANKARGLSGIPNPTGDSFDIDYVVHEMGHQFNQNHTFNATGNCGSSPAQTRTEAGSAVTIMGYAGICTSTANLAAHSIETFHVINLIEAITFINGTGATCGTLSGTNAPPVIAALTNYSIPFNTPFALTASATDANSGDVLTYNWEENDPGASVSSYPSSPDDDDVTLAARPLLRSYLPTSSPTRSFPSLVYILNNSNEAPVTYTGTSAVGAVCNVGGTCITGEDLPSIARTMNFRVTVRDGRGGNTDAGLTVSSVNTTTPFKVTTGNTATTMTGGVARTITWDVSGTTAAPISTANVKISLSTDGGQTFPTVLAASTPNDGTESVIIPSIQTTQARIKIEAVGNIFFDINDVNIIIGVAGGPAVIDAGAVAIVSESCGIPNGLPDPGETLTVSLPLSNSGGSNTANLAATLQATGGVVSAVSQTYGVVTAGGAAVSRNFTFTVSSTLPCGNNVVLTFVVADGATTFPNVTKTYTTGANSVSLTQNFDGVTAPALPAGWTSVQTSGTLISWTTTAATPSSAPNAAFGNETTTVNAAALVSPATAITSADSQIKFKNQFNLENTFDGTVLEYTTNGGTTWTDVITGGGTFVSGGYTGTISSAFMNPLGGRMAWSGASTGYVDTVVNLPASLNGQTVQFRWLTASDNSVVATGAPGQWIDDVQVLGGRVCQTCVAPNACNIQRRSDFNGDGRTDYAVFRPSSGTWFVQSNGGASSAFATAFGTAGDKLQPADYDGDGKTDLGIYRAGVWYWVRSSDNTVRSANWGLASDIPVAGDYLGVGTTAAAAQAELAVYRPSTGVWYALNTADNTMAAVNWGGAASDVPVPGDYDGDCKMDFAVRRTTNSPAAGDTQFFIRQSGSGVGTSVRWGREEMGLAIGDYDGDGKSDVGVVSNVGGLLRWYVTGLNNTVLFNGTQFGIAGDIVTVGNYDSDTRATLSIWRPSVGTFVYKSTTSGAEIYRNFGASADIPTARAAQYPLP